MPSNVSIRKIVAYPYEIRNAIHEKVAAAIKGKFPVEGERYIADVSNVEAVFGEISHEQQKKVVLTKGNKNSRIYGDLTITDKKTGKVVAAFKKYLLATLPYYTYRYTMMVDGNEYSVVSQMRTKSGVYTRKRGNDDLESAFNLERGANFKLLMDPKTGIFKMDILGSTFPAFALLDILGAQRADEEHAIGTELWQRNRDATTESQIAKARNLLFNKLVRYKDTGPDEHINSAEKDEAIRGYFANTKMDPETTKVTLGIAQTSVSVITILRAMRKIMDVYKGEADVDERDHLEFQKVYGVEDLLAEVIEKSKEIVPKIKKALDTFELKHPEKFKTNFNSSVFSQPIRTFLTSSSLSRLPSQINPMEFMDSASIITRLGEGAISSERAVPFSTRGVTYSSAGLIDPIAAPESFKVGIDVHATINAAKGSDHEFYKKLRDCKTNQIGYHRAIDLYDKRVGFPDPKYLKSKKRDDIVYATYRGDLVKCRRSELDYQIDDPADLTTFTTNSIPFMPSNQGNRLLMGDKHVQQALPLEDPDVRLVRTKSDSFRDGSVLRELGYGTVPVAPADGTVTKVDEDFIYVKDTTGKTWPVDYVKDMPLASKTFLTNTITVKVGDKVSKGQPLADSNFSKDGWLTTGKNLLVAYMPYKGLNHEDAIVVSEAAAQKMTSIHASKIFVQITRNMILGKDHYTAAFPTNFTTEQLANLDADGIVKKGTKVHEGDPLVLAIESNTDSRINQILGRLNKSLMHPYRDLAEKYEDHYEAEVTDTFKTDKLITVVLRMRKPLQIGDKLAGSYGNKGVCSVIVPTDKMPRDEEGRPLDLVLTSAGVISRINPAQTLESALGKIALKTGKPYDIENYSVPDAVEFVKGEMKKHGVKDKETLFDPETGKEIPNVFVGVQHMSKLFKTSDTNFAARGIEGGYDQDEVPTGSGATGPKGMGGMEINALLASNVRALLREGTMLRSSKNSDFWRAFQSGATPNFPTEKKTFTRFLSILKQAGINVERKGNELVAAPLTDKDIERLSSGELKTAKRLDAVDLQHPSKDGLFDEAIFGGLKGTKWGHITLPEPVVNPVFEGAARRLLGLSSKDFEELCLDKGGKYIKDRLNAIDIKEELKKSEDALHTNQVKKTELDDMVKRVKTLRALDQNNMKAGDAYVLTKFPVTPPIHRPVVISRTGDIMSGDTNDFYKDLVLQSNSFKDVLKAGLDHDDIRKEREALYKRIGEITGMLAPDSAIQRNRNVKGAIKFIAGDVPKSGYFYKKCIYGRMNMSGRATISPDVSLGLDEIGLPEDIAWGMYKPFVVREMSRMGYSMADAEDAIEQRNDVATKILQAELEKRPVIMNRAPSLWRHSMVAAKPLLRKGKNVCVNSIWEKGLNADYDGDAVNIHVPVTDEAVEDAKKLFPSHQVFNDKVPNAIVQSPTREPIIGLYKATANIGKPKPVGAKIHKFANVEAAWKAYYAGELKLTDYVDIG